MTDLTVTDIITLESNIPLVRIEIHKRKSKFYKKEILYGVHNALIIAFKIPGGDFNQRIYNMDEENWKRRTNKTSVIIIIKITAFKGRSPEVERNLYKEILKK